ncbi:MAG: hypothetical protein V1874_17045 [Spirochaetota bacterium]
MAESETINAQGNAEKMDPDIKYIIQEEQKLVQLAEDSGKAAAEKVEEHRVLSAESRKSQFSMINAEYSTKLENKLNELKEAMENELKDMRKKQELSLNETELKDKITRNIISIILEDRR